MAINPPQQTTKYALGQRYDNNKNIAKYLNFLHTDAKEHIETNSSFFVPGSILILINHHPSSILG